MAAPQQQQQYNRPPKAAAVPPPLGAEADNPLWKQEFHCEPLGESRVISLTPADYWVSGRIKPTSQNGIWPTVYDIRAFLLYCQANHCDPYSSEIYLVGSEGRAGVAFTPIPSLGILLKRAELSKQMDGLEYGVIVVTGKERVITERPGTFFDFANEMLVGAWAKCHRKDRAIPYYDSVRLESFDAKILRWNDDPSGMICKVAIATVLRKAFSNCAELYCEEEMGRVTEPPKAPEPAVKQEPIKSLLSTMKQKPAETPQQVDTPSPGDVPVF